MFDWVGDINSETWTLLSMATAYVLREIRGSKNGRAKDILEHTERAATLAAKAVEGLKRSGLVESRVAAIEAWENRVRKYAEDFGAMIDWDRARSHRDAWCEREKASAERVFLDTIDDLKSASQTVREWSDKLVRLYPNLKGRDELEPVSISGDADSRTADGEGA